MLTILVCGGRDYDDRDYVYFILDKIHVQYGILKIVHGDATGADSLAKAWAKSMSITEQGYPVTKEQWKILGRKAGPLRNQEMLDSECIDGIIAFPGGSGTQDMINRGQRAGIKVWQPNKDKK